MVGFPGQGKSDQPAEGNLSGVPARSAGPTGGGEAISACGPTCRARFARPLADAGGPSARRRFSWPEALDQGQDTPIQLTRDGHFGHLEDSITGMRGDPRIDLHQLLPDGGE